MSILDFWRVTCTWLDYREIAGYAVFLLGDRLGCALADLILFGGRNWGPSALQKIMPLDGEMTFFG